MNGRSIRTLKPNVTQEEALRAFTGAGFSAFYRRMRSGPLRQIADVYVQYYLYRVKVGPVQSRIFAIDAVDGSLDLFEFQHVPAEGEIVSLDRPNRLASGLSKERAAVLLREKVLRVIFQQGFFKVREPRLEITPEPCELHLPYWLGFYGRDGVAHCRVIDAVRRRIEGAKASAFFEQWLAA